LKKILITFFSVLICIVGFLFWCAYPWSLTEKKLENLEIKIIEPLDMISREEKPSVLKVLSWNLGFLYGLGSAGDNYESKAQEFYLKKLKLAVEQLKELNPDIIFLQEIDFKSSRSHTINQAEYFAKHAGYPYVAEIHSWKANYIPFPYWPFKNHFGEMESGGAILSRYPLSRHRAFLLSKPEAQPWWYNLFYLHRYYQLVDVTIDEKSHTVLNVHLEAFDKTNRQQQIKQLSEIVQIERPIIVAGDFNMVPTVASKKSKFADGDDYENDQSFELMKLSKMLEVIPESIYEKSEMRYFTYPSDRPDRRLDYIFYDSSIKIMKAEIQYSKISDHLPVKANFQIGPPKVNPYSL